MTFKEAIKVSPHGRAELILHTNRFSNQTECSIINCLAQGLIDLSELKSSLWKPTMDISGYSAGSLSEHSEYKLLFARKYLRDMGVI